jgi:hypothetical protein
MSDQLYKQIYQNFERKSTSELRKILADANSGEWSDDALKAAAVILADRPDDPGANEPSQEPIDRRGQSVFALSTDQITAYRTKIQILGGAICTGGLVGAAVFISPLIYGKFNAYTLGSGVLGLIIGPYCVLTGYGLMKLRAQARIGGLVLSIILLPFFPIGTIIGFCGILWLGKRGSVMSTTDESNKTPNKTSLPTGSSSTTSTPTALP